MADTKFKRQDVTGQRFRYLTAIRYVGRSTGKSRASIWEFRCDCGKLTTTMLSNVKHGHVYSCGCMKRKLISARNTKHGHCTSKGASPTYIAWRSMIARCEYSGDKEYFRYGARGISVCERWHVFEYFLADMGERPKGKTLDRIDNNNGYGPDNCRWSTHYVQVNNRRTSIKVPFNGEMLPLSEVARRTGIAPGNMRQRLAYGVPLNEVAIPGDRRKRKPTSQIVSIP